MAIVADAVATKVKVSLGTSLFLGVATAVTFSIGGAMLAGLAPGTGIGTTCYRQSGYPTLYQDAAMTTVATGNCTTILTTTEKPLAVMDVASVISLSTLQNDQTYAFHSGDQQYGTWNYYWYSHSSGSATAKPLSITATLALDGEVIPANVLFIETNLGKLNVCLPQVTAQKTFYVGASGSVYDDAQLTKRSTLSPCAVSLARAATPMTVSAGARLTFGNFIAFGRDATQYAGLGSISDYNFSTGFMAAPAGSNAPLRLMYHAGYVYPSPSFPYKTPADILTLTTDTGVLNLCFPGQTYSDSEAMTRYRYLFAGKDGALYEDALLTKRATTEACSTILARAAVPTTIKTGSRLMNSGYISLDRQAYHSSSGLGSFSNSGFNSNTYGTLLPGSQAPLRLTHSVGYSYPAPTYPYVAPADILTLTTDVGTLNLCLPSRVYASDRDGGYLFAAKDGTLYEDAHLTNRVTTEACTAVLARAAVPTAITAGSRLMNSGYINLDRQAYTVSSGLGSFSISGFNANSYGSILAGSKAPLRLTHSVGYSYPTPTYPYTSPADVLTLTTDVGSLNLCLPTRTFTSDRDGGYLFAGKDGTLYEDALLTKRATSEACATILARAATPSSITAGSRLMDGNRLAFHRDSDAIGLGYFHEGGFSSAYTILLAGSKAPLRVTHGVAYNYPAPTYPFTVSEDTLTLTTDIGTLMVCTPALTYANEQDGGYLFAGKDGSTYSDALLQNVARKCSLNPLKEIIIE